MQFWVLLNGCFGCFGFVMHSELWGDALVGVCLSLFWVLWLCLVGLIVLCRIACGFILIMSLLNWCFSLRLGLCGRC